MRGLAVAAAEKNETRGGWQLSRIMRWEACGGGWRMDAGGEGRGSCESELVAFTDIMTDVASMIEAEVATGTGWRRGVVA